MRGLKGIGAVVEFVTLIEELMVKREEFKVSPFMTPQTCVNRLTLSMRIYFTH